MELDCKLRAWNYFTLKAVIKTLINLVADVADALEGANWRQGDPEEAVGWSRECRSEPEQRPRNGLEWQILEAQLKNLSEPAVNFISKQTIDL